MPRLVVIDGDEMERRRIALALTSAGFETLEASGSVEGLLQVLDSGPDLVVLAQKMPPLHAADLLVILRRVSGAPIIVIGDGDEPEEVAVLESGADSFVRRGTRLRLLRARIDAMLRRYQGRNSSALSFSGTPMAISLTVTEKRLLTCLGNHDGKPISLEELRVEVWGTRVGVNTVRYYLRRLRNKLHGEPCGLALQCIRGVGYRLVRMESPGSVSQAGSGEAVTAWGAGHEESVA